MGALGRGTATTMIAEPSVFSLYAPQHAERSPQVQPQQAFDKSATPKLDA